MTAASFSLLIKKSNPELALLLGAAAAIFCMFAAVRLCQQIGQQIQQWNRLTLLSGTFFVPLIKCLGISVVSQLGTNLCKDAGQSAAAMGLEICGNAAAAWCLLPLVNHLFTLIEELL